MNNNTDVNLMVCSNLSQASQNSILKIELIDSYCLIGKQKLQSVDYDMTYVILFNGVLNGAENPL